MEEMNYRDCIVMLEALKLAYRKHCLGDDSIGWEELEKTLQNTLCNIMGDEEFINWLNCSGNEKGDEV